MDEITLLETIEWAQHPSDTCAGQPVIPAYNFQELSQDVAAFSNVKLTAGEVYVKLIEQSQRFTACGANSADVDRFGLVRKNPKTGWNYLVNIFTGKTEKPA